jgi:hypothetical protein
MSNYEYVIDYTISKLGAVSLIKALSEALLAESGRSDVRIRGWRDGDDRVMLEVNRDIAVVAIDGAVQS